jgi:tetratricopeptide (TPR) repeat protein
VAGVYLGGWVTGFFEVVYLSRELTFFKRGLPASVPAHTRKVLLTLIFKPMKYFLLSALFLIPTFVLSQQSKKEKMAYEIGIEALKLINEEKFLEAIELLKQAQKLDPIRMIYPFEVAYSQYNLQEYNQAIAILEELKNRQDVTDHIFQLLGNSYYNSGETEKAMEAYKKGLLRFPESGHLYLETGIVEYKLQNYREAVYNWETGIRVKPNYASNYYWLGKAFAGSNKRIWGILYSEIFMLLEPDSKRSGEMSELLFRIYDASFHFDTDSTLNTQMFVDGSENDMINFDSEVEMITAMSSFHVSGESEKPLTIHELVNIRETFIDNWHTMNLHNKYSNFLFDFHEDMREAGVFEAYNYWLFRMGDPENFKAWYKENEEKLKAFITWFNENNPSINKDNLLVRE